MSKLITQITNATDTKRTMQTTNLRASMLRITIAGLILISVTNCNKKSEEPPVITKPAVATNTVTNISTHSATSGGIVISQGSSVVTSRGVCWSISSNPTINDAHTSDSAGIGGFTSNITGLTEVTTYYVRAYATSEAGTAYGNQLSFFTGGVPVLPSVSTGTLTNITETAASCGGNVSIQGTSPVTARGICWSVYANPTTANAHTTDGSGTGDFTGSITGLIANTAYFLRSYATNSYGTTYGFQIGFTTPGPNGPQPCPGTPTVTYDGKTYNTIQIGTQCWFRENLNLGTRINGSVNQTNNGIIEKYCYDDLESNCDLYGGLYQWNEMQKYITTQQLRGICPVGWLLPKDSDWTKLTTFLGGDSIAGGSMKSSTGWDGDGTGTNSSGFTVFPGGFRNENGLFEMLTTDAFFWSSTQTTSSSSAWNRFLNQTRTIEAWGSASKVNGYSVRCIKQ
ncbi:MAG: FISUMP domain-containing protein [bacterium]